MRFMHIIIFYDFMQVLHIKRMHPTKNEYISKHILFSTIYLLQKQELNHITYSKQELIINIFVQATMNDVHMHARFECLDVYRFL
jgi:hypothetical protein